MGLRPIVQEKIFNTLIKLKGSGLAESTLRRVSYELSYLAKRCDLDNSDDVNSCIASMKGANSYKDVFDKTYSYYAKIHSITWLDRHSKASVSYRRFRRKKRLFVLLSFKSGEFLLLSLIFSFLLFLRLKVFQLFSCLSSCVTHATAFFSYENRDSLPSFLVCA